MVSLGTLRAEQAESSRGDPTIRYALPGFFPTLPEQERLKSEHRTSPIARKKDDLVNAEQVSAVSFLVNQLALAPSAVRVLLSYMTFTQLRQLTAMLISGDREERRRALQRLGRAPEPQPKKKDDDSNLFIPKPIDDPEPILVIAPVALLAANTWQAMAHVPGQIVNGLKAVGRIGLNSLRRMNAMIEPKAQPMPQHPRLQTHANVLTETE